MHSASAASSIAACSCSSCSLATAGSSRLPLCSSGLHMRLGLGRLSRGRRTAARTLALGPALGPGVELSERIGELPADRRQAVTVAIELDDARLAQLCKALGEDARRHPVAALLQLAKAERAALAQLPADTQRPAPPEQVEHGHDRPAGRGPADRPAWSGDRDLSCSWTCELALRYPKRYYSASISEARRIARCRQHPPLRGSHRWSLRMTTRHRRSSPSGCPPEPQSSRSCCFAR